MDYREATEYILSFTDYEKLPSALYSPANFDLRRMEILLQRLGNPHHVGRAIHVAGTKGKGSTSAMIASVLTACGYTTGLFTSPHLHTMRERIMVGRELITEEEMSSLVQEMKGDIEKINSQATYGQLTTFEVLTTLAFLYFQQKGVDFQVVEAGMGGRLDATNVIPKPEVCLITSVSLDHTDILGKTLAQIAWEKGGIIKQGSTLVSSPQPEEVLEVIRQMCREKGVRLIEAGKEIEWEWSSNDSYTQEVKIGGREGSYVFDLPLLGEHQVENAATAVAALEVLAEKGFRIGKEGIARGMAEVSWPGRLQVLRRRPLVVADGAHNPASARRLREALPSYFSFSRAVLVLGSSVDKDIGGIARELAPLFSTVIVTRARHPRAASCAALREEFLKQGIEPLVVEGVDRAISSAMSTAAGEDLVCITGSLFAVAEAIDVFTHLSP